MALVQLITTGVMEERALGASLRRINAPVFREAISTGESAAGEKLPPTRALAELAGYGPIDV